MSLPIRATPPLNWADWCILWKQLKENENRPKEIVHLRDLVERVREKRRK